MVNIKEILDNDELFAKEFLKIPTKPDGHGVVHLVPMVYNAVQSFLSKHLTRRNVIIKARQLGVSTGILSRNFRKILTHEHIRSLLVAHKDDSTAMLLDRVYGFYDNLPPEMQPLTDRESQRQIRFAKLDSGIHIETAGARVSGRSETLSLAHLSEVAHWSPEKIRELMAGITQAAKAGEITIESSPKGNSGYLYEVYQAAKRGDSVYEAFFFPWWWDKGYRLSRESPFALPRDRGKLTFTDEETALMNKYHLDEDQIRWRRATIDELKELFPQEYPENDIDCWLSTGIAVFDAVAIRRQQLQHISSPIKEEDGVKYWKMPLGGHRYVIGVDSGKGLPKGDFSVATVLEEKSCEQVATYRARIGTDLFGEKVKYLGKLYNNGSIVVETTGGYGDVVMHLLADYPTVYTDGVRKGWSTNAKTRPLMISTLATALRAGDIIIHDETTLQEISDFQDLGNNRLGVPFGSHDDSLFALMLALVVRQYHPQAVARAKIIRYH